MNEHFETAILGVNYYGIHKFDPSKYFIYPVDVNDVMGFDRIKQVLPDWNPDVILLFQDIFNIDIMMPQIKKWNPKIPIIGYFPIDGTPVSRTWGKTIMDLDKRITYTQWGIRVIKDSIPEVANKQFDFLYHGVDTNIFMPLPVNLGYQARKQRKTADNSTWADKFLAVSNNRFQPRKHIPGTLRAWEQFTKGYKVCKCGNTYVSTRKWCDLNMCGPEDVLETVPGHQDAILYIHGNTQERMMGPGPANTLQGHLMNAGFENTDVNTIIQAFAGNVYEKPITDEELNLLYNMADVNLSTALGEGVGLSLIESAAVGTTSIAPNNSAIPEMLQNTGHIIPNICHVNIAYDNGHLRPLVHTKKFVEALEIEYQKWLANGKKKIVNEAAIEMSLRDFMWDDKREKMLGWLKEYE
jgi:glycosyltransferase involved in cell wall biosynthesis